MFLKVDGVQNQIAAAIADAKARIGNDYFQVLSWPQGWSNTSCGFGGIAGQAFTTAQTVIASGEDDAVLVYHRGKFAYEVEKPIEKFWEACGQRRLPGAADWERVSAVYDAKPKPSKRKAARHAN